MTTSNPFEKLNVRHDKDDDDEQGEFEQVKGKDKNVPFGIETKKKKVRPKEKVEEDAGDEGFQEVKKGVPKRRPPKDDDEEDYQGNEHKKRREPPEDRENRRPKRGRGRQFDRQSGTGRGKEIAKGGAGGKYTWNDNPKNIAKNYENYNDDDYFEEALNPEKQERRQRPPRRPRKEEKQEGEEENKEENKEEGQEEGRKRDNERRRPPIKYELKEEEKLVKPENAIFLEDYLKKEEKPKEEEKKEVKRVHEGKPLTRVAEKKEDILGTTTGGKKKGKKKKEKELKPEEVELNAQIGANLEIGENFERGPRRGRRGRGERGGRGRGERGGRGGRGRGKGRDNDNEEKGGFVYDPEDFPELKK